MNQNNVNKPVSIIQADFISDLTELINKSSLPAFIIEPILKDTYNEVRAIAQRQLVEDRTAYQEALDKASQKTEDSDAKQKSGE